MKRTIKFRGKTISGGQWIFGDLVQNRKGNTYIIPIDNHYFLEQVHPDTVGQYITTINGVEIYEGMKLELDDSHISKAFVKFTGTVYFNNDPTWHYIGYCLLLESGKLYPTDFLGKLKILE